MKSYKLEAKVTISLHTIVDAETLEEAIELASERSIEAYHHSDEQSAEVWVSDEFDGKVFDITEIKGVL